MPGSPPRKINLNKEVMLPVATESLWQVTAVDNDRSTYPPALWLVAAHGGAGCTMLSEMLAFVVMLVRYGQSMMNTDFAL